MAASREWTLMFYLACDNALAPVVVPLLKEMKDAGFQANTDVLVHFDPREPGVPTRIYHVNNKRREKAKKKTHIGDGNDPFVRNLEEDNILKTSAGHGSAAMALKRSLDKPEGVTAEQSLKRFIAFCREKFPAKRYMLFLLGHGMVVGNDAFLLDTHPRSSISLKKLGEILSVFAPPKLNDDGARSSLELLSLHSCSMSAVEVAYELKGEANYLIASEGPAFAGSWPYRQLLKKIFNTTAHAKGAADRDASKGRGSKKAAAALPIDVRQLVEKVYFLTLHNATDFMLAGYSHDLALCSLESEKYNDLTIAIRALVALLVKELKASASKDGPAAERGKRIKDLVLLAHWEAQSYWGESYTDLADFCRCLRKRCDPKVDEDLVAACAAVIKSLAEVVIRSEHFGSEFQYSRGLSVFFPWSTPVDTDAEVDINATGRKKRNQREEGILDRYKRYAFTKELGKNAWLNFLTTYFAATERLSRRKEDEQDHKDSGLKETVFSAAESAFNPFGPFSILSDDPKPVPWVGIGCDCPSIKNYPKQGVTGFSISDGAATAFE